MREFMYTVNNKAGINITGTIQAEHEFDAIRRVSNRLQALAQTYPPAVSVPRIDADSDAMTIYLEEVG